MNRLCQGIDAVFGLLVAVSLAATALGAGEQPAKPAAQRIPLHLVAWEPRPFADVVVNNPDLAACFLLSQGLWAAVAPPTASVDQASLEAALGEQLRGVVEPGALGPLRVFVTGTENNACSSVAHGDTALLRLPRSDGTTVEEVARSLAAAFLVAGSRPAPPDPRCDEAVLSLAEAVANAGSLALAELPPALRPVRDWLEVKDVMPALAALAEESTDLEKPWQARKAKLVRMCQVGGASPRVANAAALAVEAFGDAAGARRAPFDFLLAWAADAGKSFPPMPHPLRKATERPLEAGMPKGKDKAERDAVAQDALARRIATGLATFAEVGVTAGVQARLALAAQARAKGAAGMCEWLAGAPLPAMRSGCRGEGEEGGTVAARPRPGSGFDVVWRSASGDEAVVLSWPRWLLFPAVAAERGELWFVDEQGVWRAALDAHTAPTLVVAGAFRHLAIAPGGAAVAAARWPGGKVVVARDSGVSELALDGHAGLAWLESDLLLAADGEKLSLASLQNEVRPGVAPLPCCASLAARGGAVFASVSKPCEPALVRVLLPERRVEPLVKLTEPALGLAPLEGGGVLFGAAEGLWRWRSGGQPERVGASLTPGPG